VVERAAALVDIVLWLHHQARGSFAVSFNFEWRPVMLTKLSMFQGADQTALTYCMCAILVQLLKRMDGAKRNALIDKAAESLEGANPGNRAVMCAISMLRGEWREVTGQRQER
jgi:hypothetical protein